MPTIDEKRVYDAKEGTTRLLVACGVGTVAVSVSGDIVGEFGIDDDRPARDVAAAEGVLAVATATDVLVGAYEATDHGPAAAVAVADGTVFAVAPDGTLARLADVTDAAWERLGTVTDVRAADGRLLATADGVVRLTDDGPEPAGLDDVRDVAGRGVPYAATDDGLYRLANGWERVVSGAFETVATDATGDRVVASDGESVVTRGEPWAATDGEESAAPTTPAPTDAATGEWTVHDEAGVVAGAVAGEQVLAVTETGTVRVSVGDGWRGRTLGVPDVVAATVAD
ncbi:hypothetical protein RYH80_09255 [Halobaculum sp. MBLA0147]|uniref:HVO_0234 family beta-propeller protein n=1 Tax=Halobaculum sp. MBLA0147 TaxID=3079934 RepID=UPI0035236AAD